MMRILGNTTACVLLVGSIVLLHSTPLEARIPKDQPLEVFDNEYDGMADSSGQDGYHFDLNEFANASNIYKPEDFGNEDFGEPPHKVTLPFTIRQLGLETESHNWTGTSNGFTKRRSLLASNTCVVYKGINFAGGALKKNGKRVIHHKIGSKGKCCRICHETDGCAAWTWSKRSLKCYLKSTGYRQQKMGWARSGVIAGESTDVATSTNNKEPYWEPKLTIGDDGLSKGFAKYIKTSSGSDNKYVVKDPTGASCDPVIKTVYPKGCWSPSSNCNGGALFYAYPEGKSGSIGEAARLEYDVYFPKGFPWVKGGKLPGLNGGASGCGGGASADKKKCFSVRLMWRRNGDGEAYVYHPSEQHSDFCQLPDTKCGGNAGTSVQRGKFKFTHEKWTKIALTVRLNDPGKYNGVLQLDIDGETMVDYRKMNYRSTESTQIDSLVFSTWFGGSDISWAPEKDVEAYWRNFKIFKLD